MTDATAEKDDLVFNVAAMAFSEHSLANASLTGHGNLILTYFSSGKEWIELDFANALHASLAPLRAELTTLRAQLASMRDALEEAKTYIMRDGHKAGAWHNDPAAWHIITKVIRPALNASPGSAGRPQWRHKKRGSVVTEIGRGHAQAATGSIEEMMPVVVYKHDGRIWVRAVTEFEDGRFEPVQSEGK